MSINVKLVSAVLIALIGTLSSARSDDPTDCPCRKPSDLFETRLYPVCNLKCDGQSSACKVTVADFKNISDLPDAHKRRTYTKVVQITDTLAAIASSLRGHSTIERNWPAFSCPTSEPLGQDQRRNQALCAANAARWLKILRERGARDVLFDEKYVIICLGGVALK